MIELMCLSLRDTDMVLHFRLGSGQQRTVIDNDLRLKSVTRDIAINRVGLKSSNGPKMAYVIPLIVLHLGFRLESDLQ